MQTAFGRGIDQNGRWEVEEDCPSNSPSYDRARKKDKANAKNRKMGQRMLTGLRSPMKLMTIRLGQHPGGVVLSMGRCRLHLLPDNPIGLITNRVRFLRQSEEV